MKRKRDYKKRWLKDKANPIKMAYIKKYSIVYRDKMRNKVFDHYGRLCRCCGEKNIEFLTIDHVNNDGYKFKTRNGKRIGGIGMHLKIIKDGFPKIYQVLCMNCNWGRRFNGICPHKVLKNRLSN